MSDVSGDIVRASSDIKESSTQFEKRKSQHIDLSLDPRNQAIGLSGLDAIRLPHNALPEINLDDVDLDTKILGKKVRVPFYISGMTAGHYKGESLNLTLAKACEEHQWIMGVGSQRRQLYDSSADAEWIAIREAAPTTTLLANIGLSQVINTPVKLIKRLVDTLDAFALVIHTNPLQEAIQPEGTPNFAGGLRAIERLCHKLKVPVLLKETGCGISRDVAFRIKDIGLAAVDVSGLGGTHWGRLEGARSSDESIFHKTAATLANWGVPTVESVQNCVDIDPDYEVWASGGVRSGLDAIKLIHLGATAVGFAKPALEASLEGDESLLRWMSKVEYEARVAMFCLGASCISDIGEIQSE